MKFYILASFIIFAMVICHNQRKSKKDRSREELSFWERERLANQTRRKSLDGLDYIRIPLDALPMHTLEEDEKVADCLQTINQLSMEPIVNFTGYTNTDLKMEYGVANLTTLSAYDQNYTLLVGTLQRWAELLHQAGHTDEAKQILEFSVRIRSDVSHAYTLLADIYLGEGQPDKIASLRETAQTLQSMNKEVILRKLSEPPYSLT